MASIIQARILFILNPEHPHPYALILTLGENVRKYNM